MHAVARTGAELDVREHTPHLFNDLFHIVNASEAAQRPKDTPHTVRHVTRSHDRRKAARDFETWMRERRSLRQTLMSAKR